MNIGDNKMEYSSALSIRKILLTLKELKKTAYHHYGDSISSIPKFFYYSFFKVNTFVVVGFDLKGEIPVYPLDPGFIVLKPTIEELKNYRSGKNLPREFYYDQIHGIKTCYLVLYGNEIAYIHWIYLKGDYNRFLKLSDGTAELNYNTTLPKFRGRGLMGRVMVCILSDLKKQGYTKAIGVVNAENPPALKSTIKAGFVELGRLKTFGPINKKFSV
jgi:hypothetical protein